MSGENRVLVPIEHGGVPISLEIITTPNGSVLSFHTTAKEGEKGHNLAISALTSLCALFQKEVVKTTTICATITEWSGLEAFRIRIQ